MTMMTSPAVPTGRGWGARAISLITVSSSSGIRFDPEHETPRLPCLFIRSHELSQSSASKGIS
jgi:hypothetical protein